MMNFEYRSQPSRAVFGSGKGKELPRHLSPYSRVMIIAGGRMQPLTEHLINEMGADRVAVFSRIIQHVPRDLVEEATEFAEGFRPDVLVAIGGGSAIGLAKAIVITRTKMQFDDGPESAGMPSFESQSPGRSSIGLQAPGPKSAGLQTPGPKSAEPLSIVAVPTTFSGSEQTDIWGISSPEGKDTGRSDLVLPELVIYDPDLFQDLPSGLAVTSAMNAMAHLVEAVYALDGNPLTKGQALQGIRALKTGLQALAELKPVQGELQSGQNPADDFLEIPVGTAENPLFGAFLAGKCLREVTMSLHHKAAHVLGGSFGLDHASVHTVLLPHVLQYQWPHLSAEIRRDFEEVLGPDPAGELRSLTKNAGGPVDLKNIGFGREDTIHPEIEKAAETILLKPYGNPAPLEKDRLVRMLQNAWKGSLPADGF